MRDTGATDRVRRFAAEHYIVPARSRREKIVKIHSGQSAKLMVENDILRANRYPIVCDALRSGKFLEDNHLRLLEVEAPPTARKGRSSTITFVYELEPAPVFPDQVRTNGALSKKEKFLSLSGILKETYRQLGGAEAFHAAERESWNR